MWQIKAVNKFKGLVEHSHPAPMVSILGQDQDPHFVQPPLSMDEDLESPGPVNLHKNHSLDIYDRDSKARDRVVSGAHDPRDFQRRRAVREEDNKNTPSPTEIAASKSPSPPSDSRTDTPTKTSISEGTRGHARDPLEEEHLYLFIGPSTYSAPPTCPTSRSGSFRQDDSYTRNVPPLEIDTNVGIPIPGSETPIDTSAVPIVSESPGATDIDIYETAYSEEIERIRSRSRDSHGPEPRMYLTRRVEKNRSQLGDILRLVREAAENDTSTAPSESEPQAQELSLTTPDATIPKDPASPATTPANAKPTATTSQPAPSVGRKSSTSVSSTSTEASKSAARLSRTGLRSLVGRLRGKGPGKEKDARDGAE
jgi:[calcium/calmodulin-dependent protein kinase] kinase